MTLRFPAILRSAALFSLITVAPVVWADEVWIEDTPDGKLVMRFADYGDEYRKSPGYLDSLTLPFAFKPSEPAKEEAPKASDTAASREMRAIREGKVDEYEVQKKSDHFLLVNGDPSKAALAETGFTVMGNGGDPAKPARKPYFYARWQPPGTGAARPGLNLDIVPTGKPGEACVYLKGKPLAGAKVKMFPPAEAEKELVADDAGIVHFEATKPGLYLLTVARQRETLSGFYGGKAYDLVSHNCSLSWRQK